MSLDLSALEESFVEVSASSATAGKPMDLALTDIEEDPNQPRKEFSSEAMAEITASIRERGVKSPVSVRPHPQKSGKWLLNFGARRYRGSAAAGKKTIPAFIDESHNDYDQVIENTQRDNLRPIELALFIQRKLDGGASKAEIARGLSLEKSVITFHLSLIDAPAVVEEAYRSGRCTSPRTLYELRLLHEANPKHVEAWCTSADEITRTTVARLAASLRLGDHSPASNRKRVGAAASTMALKGVASAQGGARGVNRGPTTHILPMGRGTLDQEALEVALARAEALCSDIEALAGRLGPATVENAFCDAAKNAVNAQNELNQLLNALQLLRERAVVYEEAD